MIDREANEIAQMTVQLRQLYNTRSIKVKARICKVSDTPSSSSDDKIVHFIRHGEGLHNAAQKEWYNAKKPGEPYTLDHDPSFHYLDAKLTPLGEEQARLIPTEFHADLYLTSPLRRATETLQPLFEAQGGKRAFALEWLHEIAGKHTCDKRKSLSALRLEYPWVDYSLVETEEDPFWGDGLSRESYESVQQRGEEFLRWLKLRPEKNIVVATHSGFLNTLFNSVLECESDEYRGWFATGEMRSMTLSFM